MGENLKKKYAASFIYHGDQALHEFKKTNLWSKRPEITAKDYVCRPTTDVTIKPGTDVLLERESDACVRVITGARELGILEDAGDLAEALHHCGGVGRGTIRECSAFGEFTVRVKEEKS